MPQIIDISPTSSNTNASDPNHSVIGRMLSIASPDGQQVFAGSYSNIWASSDGGQSFEQLTWPQPAAGDFDVPGSLGGWCAIDLAAHLGWRVTTQLRMLAPLTSSGHLDIVGFGDGGVWTALGDGNGGFAAPRVVLNNFGYQAGGWQVNMHPRFVVDLNGDGMAEIVGFGDAGVWTAMGNGDGTFAAPGLVLGNYGVKQGWQVDKHPRFLAVLTSSGFADIVGFGTDGVWTALGNGDGTFREPNTNPVLGNFGVKQGWQVDKHPRMMARLTRSGFADIVGFGTDGVWTALSNGDGTFREPPGDPVLANFCVKQGWEVDKHPRMMAPLAKGGVLDDIVGFGDKGVYVALSNGDGTFREPHPNPVLANFGLEAGDWQVDKHPRFAVPLSPGAPASIVGFGDAGVWTAVAKGDGTFNDANFVLANFGLEAGGWQVDKHPRFVAPLSRGGLTDIVGFGDAGVWTSLGDGQGHFPTSNFVLACFGYGSTLLAMMANDLVAGSRGIWRSPDGGGTWVQVHQFSSQSGGQLLWAAGNDHLVYAAGGSSLALSQDGGLTFTDAMPWGAGASQQVNHVAVALNAPSDLMPAAIYALSSGAMSVSLDGGATWIVDQGPVPSTIGAPTSSTALSNTPTMMVVSPRSVRQVIVAGDGTDFPTPAVLWSGDYSQFSVSQPMSSWSQLPVPQVANNPSDSGNSFLTVTQPGRGDLLFYSSQRWDGNSVPFCYVGPLNPASDSDWKKLDTNVHMDLHGLLLSPDFSASLSNGNYTVHAGTVWLLSDGGIYRSTDGGMHFNPAHNAQTLSLVNFAGVSVAGKGPALSLNEGDNDGFYSTDGGAHWTYQQYGGGDNDCSFADPLQPNAMLVFTPRWDTSGNLPPKGQVGQTVSAYFASSGQLPDARSGTNQRKAVTGPPASVKWNAASPYGNRGTRPIVLGLATESPLAKGDYIFLVFGGNSTVVVRTQDIWDIASRDEWITTATGPNQGARVYLQGPPLPLTNLGVLQSSGGHANTVFYVGGAYIGGSSNNTLWKATATAASWTKLVPTTTCLAAVRFFVDPYRPNLIYVLDTNHVRRSDDGGSSWQIDTLLEQQLTWSGRIAISTDADSSGVGDHFDLILTNMQFHPTNPSLRFATGLGGAFFTTDGVNWMQVLHTGAMAGRPTNCYYDWIFDPKNPVLYVGFAGRSLVKIKGLPASSAA